MRQSLHAYIVPPTFFTLHALLLLPILVPYRPDNSIAESPLQLAWSSARYALPLGCLAFMIAGIFRLVIGSLFPPVAESRTEWITLFSIGATEEIIRWGLVRYLTKLEGGGGGYGAKHRISKGHSYTGFHDVMIPASIEVQPGIWEGVYLMGWSWSFLESVSVWWLLRPNRNTDTVSTPDHENTLVSSRPQSYHSWRKEHAKKRSTDTTIRTIRGLSMNIESQTLSHERLVGMDNAYAYQNVEGDSIAQSQYTAKLDERASSPELSRRSVREEDNDAGDEETSATDNDNDALDSPLTPTVYRPAYDAAVPTRYTRNLTDEEDDEQEESTPTQQKHNSRFLPPGSITSESDYFGGREVGWPHNRASPPKRMISEPSRRLSVLASDSDAESLLSGTQTPLLSSSIPLDQERSPLFESSSQKLDYGSTAQPPSVLGNLPPPPPEMQMNRSDIPNRPPIASHSSYLSIATGDEAEDESDSHRQNGMARAYPSHPAFSSSYIHTHFPASGTISSNAPQITTINTLRFPRPKLMSTQSLPLKRAKPRKPRAYSGITRQGSISSQPTVDSMARPYINGVDVNSVTLLLVTTWAVITALQHIGYGLWFAWFPTPLFEDTPQWWSILFFGAITFSKGVYFAQSGSGWIISNGLLWPTTIGCTILSFVLYFIVLVLWGVLW